MAAEAGVEAVPRGVLGRWSALVVVAALLFCARFVSVGADTYWAVAVGRDMVRTGSIPDGIPFAAASSSGWPNVPVLGELVLAGLAAPGPVGIVAAQLALDVVALVLLALGAREAGASDGATAISLAVVVLGALPALASVKMQLFSLALFPILLALLRSDRHRPSRRIWWVVLVIAVWGNLHGAVLLGVAVTGAYLLFSRLRQRPAETIAVGLATLVALATNPAVFGTAHYYAGVLGNEAARRGTELWARPNPANLFDLLLILAGVALMVLALWSRPPLWEVVAILGLLVGTASSARHSVWLLMACVAPAAVRLTRRRQTSADRPPVAVPLVAGVVLLLGCGGLLASRLDALNPSGNPELVAAVKTVADGRVVLADEPVVESLAAEGVRIWMSNPIDAFDRSDQAAYLDFVSGSSTGNSRALLDAAEVVVVRTGGPADGPVSTDSRFAPERSVAGWTVYSRMR
ncbi:MAG: hypothetical protein ABJA74_00510 [Lapillicoccus sp.]